MISLSTILIAAGIFLVLGFRIVMEYERGVVFRLGKFKGVKTSGLKFIIPFIDKMRIVNIQRVAFDIPPQDVITKDNVSVKVNAVLNFRVVEPEKAVIDAEDYMYITSQAAQTTLRAVVGQHELDDLLSERDKINERLQQLIDQQTDAYGIKVATVEIKDVDLPQAMQRAMAKQAEAERERRAKVINAEGEYQAAQKLAEASDIISKNPTTIQLRYLQTLSEISTDAGTRTIIPIPLDLVGAVKKLTGQ